VPAPQACPSCGSAASATALFCEACGYDFTTGTMPRPPDPAPVPDAAPAAPAPLATQIPLEWVAELWVDPDWYAAQQSDDPCPSPGLPVVVPLTSQSVLVGRPSNSRNIHPDVDCTSDTGVSRRQAQLTTDGQRWWVEDLQSSNGTYVGPASGPVPTVALPPGQRRELDDDDRVYIGTWTRLVVRRATPEEQAGETS
jgi:pSer/pThr/pTyr-binding forkhead associated (FHA) protein